MKVTYRHQSIIRLFSPAVTSRVIASSNMLALALTAELTGYLEPIVEVNLLRLTMCWSGAASRTYGQSIRQRTRTCTPSRCSVRHVARPTRTGSALADL